MREVSLGHPEAILSLASHERERFAEVAAQAKRWPAAHVLLTTPAAINQYNCDACSHRREWLEALGVDAARIVLLEPPTVNTRAELAAAAAWMRQRGLTRLLIVTSPYHTRRVNILVGRAMRGIETGLAASPALGGLPKPWWTRRYGRWYVTYEYAALLATFWR